MPSTYSPTLRIELIADGEQDGTWGNTTNTNLGSVIEQAITGVQSITMADADYTLTAFNGLPDEARNAVLVVGGTLSADTRSVIAPAVEKVYIVRNQTAGGYSFTFKPSGGTGITVPNGSTMLIYLTTTHAYSGINVNNITGDLAITGNLTAVNGTFSGNGSVGGTLSVGGVTTVRGIINQQTVTMTIASPCVVTLGTALPANTPIVFTTTGALPTGITAGVTYYVYNPVGSTCNLVSSLGSTTAINTSGSQSGVHTGTTGIIEAVNATRAYSAASADTATTAGTVTSATSNGFGVRAVVPSPITSAAFTGSVSGNTLTVSSVSSGTLFIGEVVNASGVPNNTTITAFGTGTGGAGTYTLSSTCATGTVDTTNSSATITLTVSSGTVALGQVITATNIPANTRIVSFGTGTGGSGTYTISTQATGTASGTSFTNTVPSATTFTGNTSGTASFTGSASSGTTTLTASSVTGGIMVGSYVTGTGIATGTYVTAYGASTYGGAGTYTLSKQTTGIVSGSVTASATPTGGTSGDIIYGY